MASQSAKDGFKVEGGVFNMWKKLHNPELFGWVPHTRVQAKNEEKLTMLNFASHPSAPRQYIIHPSY